MRATSRAIATFGATHGWHGLVFGTAAGIFVASSGVLELPPAAAWILVVLALFSLRAIGLRHGLDDRQSTWMPVACLAALLATSMVLGRLLPFRDWVALLILASILLSGSRLAMLVAMPLGVMASVLALWMPLVLLPLWHRPGRWISSITWLVVAVAAASAARIAWAGQWPPFAPTFEFSRLAVLLPSGTALIAVVALALMLERFVLKAQTKFRASLLIALLACLAQALVSEPVRANVLALLVAPLVFCLVDGARQVRWFETLDLS